MVERIQYYPNVKGTPPYFPKDIPGDPGELRSRPTVAQQLPSNYPRSRDSAQIRPESAVWGHVLTKSEKNIGRISTTIEQNWSICLNLGPTLARICANSAKFGRVLPLVLVNIGKQDGLR